MLFCLNSSSTILGARPYLTLYINIVISCSLRFSSEGRYARTRRLSYHSEWELNILLWVCPLYFSAVRRSAVMPYQMSLCWVRQDGWFVDYISFALNYIKFRSLNKTPTFWLSFMQMLLIWLVKLSLISTPNNLICEVLVMIWSSDLSHCFLDW